MMTLMNVYCQVEAFSGHSNYYGEEVHYIRPPEFTLKRMK